MPLLCLLLERVLWTMNTAKISMVSEREFRMLHQSFGFVIGGMSDRCRKLQGQMPWLLPFYHLPHIIA
jgi:hypothetical protein